MRRRERAAPFHELTRGLVLGSGQALFDEAAERLMTWRVHRDSGLVVRPDGPRALPGVRVLLRLGLGPIGVDAPCVVVGVVAEPTEQGFTYRTLPGHPEEGDEHFRVSLGQDGTVRGTVSALSRPSSRLARAGGAITTTLQRVQTDRYLAAMAPGSARARRTRSPRDT